MNKRPEHVENPDWKPFSLRLQGPLMRELESVCSRLNLEKSEVGRRAIAVGLKSFNDVDLPGTLPGSRWGKVETVAAQLRSSDDAAER